MFRSHDSKGQMIATHGDMFDSQQVFLTPEDQAALQ